jgi:tellurite resistance protein TerC
LTVIAGVLLITVIASLAGVRLLAARVERHAGGSRGKGSKTDLGGHD